MLTKGKQKQSLTSLAQANIIKQPNQECSVVDVNGNKTEKTFCKPIC